MIVELESEPLADAAMGELDTFISSPACLQPRAGPPERTGLPSRAEIEALTGEVKAQLEHVAIFPASHYVVPKEKMMRATENILAEMKEQVTFFKSEDKLLEAQRLEMRVNYDLEMLETMNFCSGIENYSRHMDGREPGEPPYTLIDYFPKDFMLVVERAM